ncbi:unnamed protein product [Pleuronectes platessa]|uniref:Uncharacterized protein n=1 Tax=Pleuronectes platessa TaxID=8262 RepID=A0A9N7U1B4_PLEPL|nr:unnamed protein product [Pleuronectes platessa]
MVSVEFSKIYNITISASVNPSCAACSQAAQQKASSSEEEERRGHHAHLTQISRGPQSPHLILPGIRTGRADPLMIPEKVTAVWAHAEADVPAHHGLLDPLTAPVCLDLKCPCTEEAQCRAVLT